MRVVYTDAHAAHAPKMFLVRGRPAEIPERPDRAEALLDAARSAGHEVVAPDDHGPAPIAAVHSPRYLHFLEHAWTEWQALPGAGEEVVPNVHPARGEVTYPEGIVGRAGFHLADTACPIGEGTWRAAKASANVAVHAASRVLDGDRVAYALARPPGHHAYADMAGGFCYLNNSAIAAQYLVERLGRVAILDVDVHHGNGTQGIFYHRREVLHVSLHADPRHYYPYFWGHAHEHGAGDGKGFNINVPLPLGTEDDAYADALERTLPYIEHFAPAALVVALGLDAFAGDPLQGMAITTAGFARIAAPIARLGLPTVLVQEGGYPCPELGANLASFLEGFENA